MRDDETITRGDILDLKENFKEMTTLRNQVDFWKATFGWTLAALIIVFIIMLIFAGSISGEGVYTPQEVADVAIKLCKELR